MKAYEIRDGFGLDKLVSCERPDPTPGPFQVRVRVKARVDEGDAAVDTLAPLYNAARYAERECHDMYGIRFRGNDDLRPILLYEGFEGHPLRRDYPKQKEQPLVPYRDVKP